MRISFSNGGSMVIKSSNPLESMALKQWVESSCYPSPETESTEVSLGSLVIEDSDGKDLIDDRWEAVEMVKRIRKAVG
ncbi:hypothetical protein [Oceanispirochaeta sp.]|jgi:hypothetical protein|uniref:hypothetical protein n=1 Tax=Oceanispirochaeta sp. TaxID=2035350 RepID=UPI002632BB8A|nr:hypothetical protein [Oceanispirochaeta sp.]MDA3957202.1 hypothetical protein [Oceanispirochaeta sp.]